MLNTNSSAGTKAQQSDAEEVPTSRQYIANTLVGSSTFKQRPLKFRAWSGKEIVLPEYADKEHFHLFADGSIVETHEHGYERHELTSYRSPEWIVMQFTGIKDIHGIDIYEGDILKTQSLSGDTISVVVYNTDVCSYVKKSVKLHADNGNVIKIYGFVRLEVRKDELEILGNVFQNPEILG